MREEPFRIISVAELALSVRRRGLLVSLRGMYPTFLSPLRVSSNVVLRNRAIMGSIHTGMEDKEADFHDLGLFLSERAANNGAAMIITGGVAPNKAGWVSPFSGRLSSSSHVKRHQILTNAVKKEGESWFFRCAICEEPCVSCRRSILFILLCYLFYVRIIIPN
jgi:hypothetical protein